MAISGTRVAGLQVSSQATCPIPTGKNGLWVDSGTANVIKFRKTDGTDTSLGAGGGSSSTLATAYTTGASQTDSTFSLDATRLGLIVKDAASTVGNLLKIQNNGGTTTFFNVPGAASIEVRSGVADGASAVGAILDAANSLANATAKTLSVRNAGTELWYYAPSAQGTAGKGKLKATSADDFWIESADGLAKIKCSTTAGTVMNYNTTTITLGSNCSITGGSGAAAPLLVLTGTGNVASGVAGVQIYPSTYKTFLAMGTGNTDVTATIVEEYLASGTVTAGDVVVWSGTTTAKTVATAAASANLTTIAGVAITTATNANVQVVTLGRCKVKCAAAFAPAAGALLGTSAATAGAATNGTPGAGAIIGRALTGDNTASSGSGFCWVQVALA